MCGTGNAVSWVTGTGGSNPPLSAWESTLPVNLVIDGVYGHTSNWGNPFVKTRTVGGGFAQRPPGQGVSKTERAWAHWTNQSWKHHGLAFGVN